MHHPERAEITAEFLVEGAGRAVVRRTWPAGADFTGSSVSAQFAGEKRAGLDRLRRLAQLTAPAEDDVRETSAALRHGATGLDAVTGSPAGRARALAGLLTAALQHHDALGTETARCAGGRER